MKNILKPKTKQQMVDAFITKYTSETSFPPARRQFEKDLKHLIHRIKFNIFQRWTINILLWIFCISWIIQAMIALDQKFFWFPVAIGTKSMLGFINIFWAILWFVVPLAIISYSIYILIENYYENL